MITGCNVKPASYIIGICLFIACACTNAGEGVSGSTLLKSCQAAIRLIDNTDELPSEMDFGAGYCIGLVTGEIQMNQLYLHYLKLVGSNLPGFLCIPVGVTGSQLTRVIIKHLEDNPAKLHLDSRELVLNALMESFECSIE